MATRESTSRPPFPLERPTSASWREQALSKIAELRFLCDWLLGSHTGERLSPETRRAVISTIDEHLAAASEAAKGGPIWRPRNLVAAVTGSGVERVISQLDAVEGELLRVAAPAYLEGELAGLLAHTQLHLRADDPRRIKIEEIFERLARDDAQRNGRVPVPAQPAARSQSAGGIRRLVRRTPDAPPSGGDASTPAPVHHARGLTETDRQAVISAVRAASSESRWKVARLRSFRNVIAIASVVLSLAVAGITVFAFRNPAALPMCFTPANVVCATSTAPVPKNEEANAAGEQSAADQAKTDAIMRKTARGLDVAVVELVGLIAAAIAAAAAMRNVQGTSTPYSLPATLAVLKLPTGALTALLGLLLMRGGFVPGLSALDSSAQIIAWALVFGYAQQILTRLVDNQAQSVLEGAGGDTQSLAANPPETAAHAAARAAETGARRA